jgi:hypothetical protein
MDLNLCKFFIYTTLTSLDSLTQIELKLHFLIMIAFLRSVLDFLFTIYFYLLLLVITILISLFD